MHLQLILKTIMVLVLISQAALAADGEETVRRFVEAFNQRDIDAMLGLSAPDMKWMSISGQQIAIETSTRAELQNAMSGYFQSTPGTKSEIRHIYESGAFVYALEEAFWTANGVEKSQCSMAVYELAGGKLQHVWYFPSHQCP